MHSNNVCPAIKAAVDRKLVYKILKGSCGSASQNSNCVMNRLQNCTWEKLKAKVFRRRFNVLLTFVPGKELYSFCYSEQQNFVKCNGDCRCRCCSANKIKLGGEQIVALESCRLDFLLPQQSAIRPKAQRPHVDLQRPSASCLQSKIKSLAVS